MGTEPTKPFGKRRPAVPVVVKPGAPAKRSGQVGLLLMGTLAVGAGAYALMPRQSCEPVPSGMAAPSNAECPPRGSSSGGHGGSGGGTSRSSYYGGDNGSNPAASGTSDSGSSHVTRGGFGSFAHAFGFSGG
jgi:hypothetical protein